MVEESTDFWDDHILFLEYLKTHPTTARNYEAMKRDLATLHADRTAFTDAKTPFIRGCSRGPETGAKQATEILKRPESLSLVRPIPLDVISNRECDVT
jgi:hypothetical protein